MVFLLLHLVVLTPLSLALTPAAASTVCDVFLIPDAGRAFVRIIERADPSNDVVKQVASGLLQLFAMKVDAEIRFESEPSKYFLGFKVRRVGRTVRIEVDRILSLRDFYKIEQRGLRSPLVDVWAGVASALIEMTRLDPTIEKIQVQGMYMYNRKFRALVRRRFGFGKLGRSSPSVSLYRRGAPGVMRLRTWLSRLFDVAR